MNRQGVWWETRKINTVLAPPEKLLLDDHCRFTFPSSTLLPYPSALNLGCLLINTVPTKCSSQQLRLSALLVPLPVLPFPISSRGSLLTTQYLHSSAASSGRPSLITPGSPASCQLYLIHGHWSLSCVWLFATPWTAACQASLSITSCIRLFVFPWTIALPGFSVHGILQARILERLAIPFSKESSQPRDWTWVSCTAGWFFTIWTATEAQ